MSVFYVCKMCGRSLRIQSGPPPKFCYFDRMSAVENISEEDAEKMGLFSGYADKEAVFKNVLAFEFPKDINYDPFTGNPVGGAVKKSFVNEYSLSDWQDVIMSRVRGVFHFEQNMEGSDG